MTSLKKEEKKQEKQEESLLQVPSVSELLELWNMTGVKNKNNVSLLEVLKSEGINTLDALCSLTYNDLRQDFSLKVYDAKVLIENIKEERKKFIDKNKNNNEINKLRFIYKTQEDKLVELFKKTWEKIDSKFEDYIDKTNSSRSSTSAGSIDLKPSRSATNKFRPNGIKYNYGKAEKILKSLNSLQCWVCGTKNRQLFAGHIIPSSDLNNPTVVDRLNDPEVIRRLLLEVNETPRKYKTNINIYHRRNFFLVCKLCEDAFEEGKYAILPDNNIRSTGSFSIYILDIRYIAQNIDLRKRFKSSLKFENKPIGAGSEDLWKLPLLNPKIGNNYPSVRAFVYKSINCLQLAKGNNWISKDHKLIKDFDIKIYYRFSMIEDELKENSETNENNKLRNINDEMKQYNTINNKINNKNTKTKKNTKKNTKKYRIKDTKKNSSNTNQNTKQSGLVYRIKNTEKNVKN